MMRNYLKSNENDILTNHYKTAVQKDLYNEERLHHQLQCEKANLMIFKKDSEIEILEAMQNIKGRIEGENTTRLIETSEGVYQYNQHRFLSPEVFFQEEKLLEGTAKNLAILIDSHKPYFQAEHIRASPLTTNISINAADVKMHEEEIEFSQESFIENQMGFIFSKHMTLTRDWIRLEDDSYMHFHDSSKISCQKAFIDLKKQKASFTTKAMYQEPLFSFLSDEISCFFDQNHLRQLIGKSNVSLHHKDFHLLSDYLLYQKESQMVLAWKKGDSKCLVWKGPDQIKADHLIIHGKTGYLDVQNPTGLIHFGDKQVRIQAKHLLYQDHVLELKDEVFIDEAFLHFTGPKIQLYENPKAYPHKIYSLKAPLGGNFYSIFHGHPMLLEVPGPFIIERNFGRLDARALDLSIQFSYKDLKVQADAIQFLFDELEHKITPTSIRLIGNIRMTWNDTFFAHADEIYFNLLTNSAILLAKHGKNVRIYDESNELKMMAEEIHIKKEKNSAFPTIRAVGNTKMQFDP